MPKGGKRDGAGRKPSGMTAESASKRMLRMRERRRLELAALDPVERMRQQISQLKDALALSRGRERLLSAESRRQSKQQNEDIQRVGDHREELRRQLDQANAEIERLKARLGESNVVPFPKGSKPK